MQLSQNNGWLSEKEFYSIYDKVPRLCVDLVIQDDEKVLLSKRSIEPYKNQWHFPGGTLYKGETVTEAAIRIARQETGLSIKPGHQIGYIEFLEEKRGLINMHTISIVVEGLVLSGSLSLDKNASALDYFEINSLPSPIITKHKEFIEKLK